VRREVGPDPHSWPERVVVHDAWGGKRGEDERRENSPRKAQLSSLSPEGGIRRRPRSNLCKKGRLRKGEMIGFSLIKKEKRKKVSFSCA